MWRWVWALASENRHVGHLDLLLHVCEKKRLVRADDPKSFGDPCDLFLEEGLQM
jgi:hypothetical protein